MFDQYSDIVTVDELCEMLSIGKNAAYQLLASRELKAFRHNRVWKIPKVSVIDYLLVQSGMKGSG